MTNFVVKDSVEDSRADLSADPLLGIQATRFKQGGITASRFATSWPEGWSTLVPPGL